MHRLPAVAGCKILSVTSYFNLFHIPIPAENTLTRLEFPFSVDPLRISYSHRSSNRRSPPDLSGKTCSSTRWGNFLTTLLP